MCNYLYYFFKTLPLSVRSVVMFLPSFTPLCFFSPVSLAKDLSILLITSPFCSIEFLYCFSICCFINFHSDFYSSLSSVWIRVSVLWEEQTNVIRQWPHCSCVASCGVFVGADQHRLWLLLGSASFFISEGSTQVSSLPISGQYSEFCFRIFMLILFCVVVIYFGGILIALTFLGISYGSTILIPLC